MRTQQIIEWLEYWNNAKMVSIDRIRAFDQVHLARKYCSCMRSGRFTEDQVSDLQIWRAIKEMRRGA